ncbi:hypothetical protein [Jejuia pallidilutea]|uniref:Uncharacterized protein n=1 Tax=Jejuia pallidilutea TaxID=504487 RepID=A0A090W1Z5_9FLAO|nr:hypothetical protein [Jejuia pallidilutea]PQV46282.1 hypothetical protein CLV33_11079 [Jejuia pallidilutea]GAL67330.1 hypothetical protein JCM19301_2682 [Jejuia pallidilutea]GAL71010.1 hypothetical protein JCM19302_2965 [Jejuia pallidilutea]GAL90056.1 hypothetical protein JCM19538_797 [Jejuia pallidilutea]
MNTLLLNIQEAEKLNDLSTIISILSIGFVTILILLTISLFEVYKQKKRIIYLEKKLKLKQ